MATTDKVKKDRQVSAKASIKERRALAAQRRQRQQQTLLAVVAVALLVGVIAMVFLSTRPAEAFIPDETPTRYQELAAMKYIGTTPEGYPYLGKADAPSVMEEFSNFACPHCLDYHGTVFLNLMDKIKAGELKFVYVPIAVTLGFNPEIETRAALCAAQQGKFWEMQDILFDWQTRYAKGANDMSRLTGAAGALGLDTGKFTDCINNSSDVRAIIDRADKLSTARKVQGTPTVFLNGEQIAPALPDKPAPTLSELRGLIEQKANPKITEVF